MDRIILAKIIRTVLSVIGNLKASSAVKTIFEKTVPMLCVLFEKMFAKKENVY